MRPCRNGGRAGAAARSHNPKHPERFPGPQTRISRGLSHVGSAWERLSGTFHDPFALGGCL
jgi:hypothetical protein